MARKADPVQAAALEKLKIPGLGFYPEELRTYPQGSVASHVLGFAGTDNHGLDGLERSLTTSWRGGPASRRSSRIRSAARSTSSPRDRSGRAAT